ncbi:hypothetical protein L249_5444, partial [Ophiocordyceps polyrhachis-furcata BCC 54312]
AIAQSSRLKHKLLLPGSLFNGDKILFLASDIIKQHCVDSLCYKYAFLIGKRALAASTRLGFPFYLY